MREVKSIAIQFQNDDKVIIPVNYFGDFCIADVTEFTERITFSRFETTKCTSKVVFELFKEVNEKRRVLPLVVTSELTVTERLVSRNDIIGFTLFYEDESQDKVYVRFCPDENGCNPAQKCYVSELVNLYLVIADNKDITDYFDLEVINNEAKVEWYKHADITGYPPIMKNRPQ